MPRLDRPWHMFDHDGHRAYMSSDCLLFEDARPPEREEHVLLMKGAIRGETKMLCLHPYPKRDVGVRPAREGFPTRPRQGQEPWSIEERRGADALQRMNEVLARVQELEEALDDPAHVWARLREAWDRAQNEEDPRMAEIVRQAREVQPVLRDLMPRIRRVLRRHRELTPLARVQEMDRSSMVWLSRQAGRTVPERAGSAQRIMATTRKENFDTLENRVLHAYVLLAVDVAREWQREHQAARASARYQRVEAFRKKCRLMARTLADLGVTVAAAGITPNYVLMQDRGYRTIYQSWIKLLQRQKIIDDLWAWQAETWTDFAVLAITLALDELDEAQLVAQSPISWRAEALCGRWFSQDRPIAVFWLRETGRIVEVQARPETPGTLLTAARAHVALRITDPSRADVPRRVPVWTPHSMERLDLETSVRDAARHLELIQQLATSEIMRNGLIITPAHGVSQTCECPGRRAQVQGIAMGASGETLATGLQAVRDFVRGELHRSDQ